MPIARLNLKRERYSPIRREEEVGGDTLGTIILFLTQNFQEEILCGTTVPFLKIFKGEKFSFISLPSLIHGPEFQLPVAD